MSVTLFERQRETTFEKRRETPARSPRRGELAHPECPIEQRLRGRDAATKARFAQLAWRRDGAPEGALLVDEHDGLRVLAPSESVLTRAVARIVRGLAGRVVDYPPAVRYVPGDPVLEPYMMVLAGGPQRHLPLVEKDLRRRRGRIVRASERGGMFVVQAEAPLAGLIGYRGWLAEWMEGGVPQLKVWLSRYLAVGDDGPRAA